MVLRTEHNLKFKIFKDQYSIDTELPWMGHKFNSDLMYGGLRQLPFSWKRDPLDFSTLILIPIPVLHHLGLLNNLKRVS